MPFGLRRLSLVLALTAAPLLAHATTIGFEELSDGAAVGQTYLSSGASFTHATVLSSGISLNELEFPPHSGQNVATDDGGPITITFSMSVISFSAYFTYADPLKIVAFDAMSVPVASTVSLYAANYASSGKPTNELLSLSVPGGIASLTITGDAGGGSFVLDDVSYTTKGSALPSPVPEPEGFWLLATGLAGITLQRRHL